MLPSPSISHSFQDSPPLHDNSRISAVQHRNRQWRITYAGCSVVAYDTLRFLRLPSCIKMALGADHGPRHSYAGFVVCVPGHGQMTHY